MQRLSTPEKLSGLHGKAAFTYSVNLFVRSSVRLLFWGFPRRRSSPAYMEKLPSLTLLIGSSVRLFFCYSGVPSPQGIPAGWLKPSCLIHQRCVFNVVIVEVIELPSDTVSKSSKYSWFSGIFNLKKGPLPISLTAR